MNQEKNIIESVQNYYGEILKTNDDLQTSACCLGQSPQKFVQEIINEIHPDVLNKFYGCGSPIPNELKNRDWFVESGF